MPADDALTHDDARRLLRLAADTIDVSNVADAPLTPASRWSRDRHHPFAIAAAVVVLLIGGGLVWKGFDHDAGPPPTEPRNTGPVPTVLGYERDDAVELLEDAGFIVTVAGINGCGPIGYATDTVPGTGRSTTDGRVTLRYVQAAPPNAGCDPGAPSLLGLELLAFARGVGPAPPFADQVTLIVDNGRPRTVAGAKLADAVWWRSNSALGPLRRAAGQTRPGSGDEASQVPALASYDAESPVPVCDAPRPRRIGGQQAHRLAVGFPDDLCTVTIDLYGDLRPEDPKASVIDTVVANSGTPARTYGRSVVPMVAGLGLQEARDQLAMSGFRFRVVRDPVCQPTGVTATRPAGGTRLGIGEQVIVHLETTDSAC